MYVVRFQSRCVELNNGSSHQQNLYDAQGAKLAYMNTQTVQKYLSPLANGVQAVLDSNGISYYRHADWLGSSRLAGFYRRGCQEKTLSPRRQRGIVLWHPALG